MSGASYLIRSQTTPRSDGDTTRVRHDNTGACVAADFEQYRTFMTSCDSKRNVHPPSLWEVTPSFPSNDKTQVSIVTRDPATAVTYALTMDATCNSNTVSLTPYTGVAVDQYQQFTLDENGHVIHSAACPYLCLSPPVSDSTNRHVTGEQCDNRARVATWSFVSPRPAPGPSTWPRIFVGIIAGAIIAALLYGAIGRYAESKQEGTPK